MGSTHRDPWTTKEHYGQINLSAHKKMVYPVLSQAIPAKGKKAATVMFSNLLVYFEHVRINISV
jgi:hypothetical protein